MVVSKLASELVETNVPTEQDSLRTMPEIGE